MHTKEKKYSYNGKEYNLRTKSFKPYRIKAIQFINRYNEFESLFISDLQANINQFLFTDKKVQSKIVTAKSAGDTSKLNKAVIEALLENPEYAVKAQELTNKKILTKELFLTTDKDGNVSDANAKELCEIMFEDSSGIDHDPQTEKEYTEYTAFIYGVFDDFFLKFKV
jgi:hypothetical protein